VRLKLAGLDRVDQPGRHAVVLGALRQRVQPGASSASAVATTSFPGHLDRGRPCSRQNSTIDARRPRTAGPAGCPAGSRHRSGSAGIVAGLVRRPGPPFSSTVTVRMWTVQQQAVSHGQADDAGPDHDIPGSAHGHTLPARPPEAEALLLLERDPPAGAGVTGRRNWRERTEATRASPPAA